MEILTFYRSLVSGEGGIDIGDLNTDKRLSETATRLEFLLLALCKAFSMGPKQAAGMLTNANKYLNIAIVKGLKGQFEPVVNLY